MRTYHWVDFRKCLKSCVCNYHNRILEERSMPWSGELLIPRSERELRCSEGSGKLIDDPLWWGEQCWLDPQGERPITELWGAEKLGRSKRSGMLIGDPLAEGSSAGSTDGELWRAENSFLRMRGTQLPMRSSRAEKTQMPRRERHAHWWPSMVRLSNASSTNKESKLSQSSGERRTHPSE